MAWNAKWTSSMRNRTPRQCCLLPRRPGLLRRLLPSGLPLKELAGIPTCRRFFVAHHSQGKRTRTRRPSGGLADPASDVGVSAGSLRATLGLVDPRSDPKVHSIVAEKQLPTELLDEWTSWAWMKDEEPVHSLEIFTDGAASVNDV